MKEADLALYEAKGDGRNCRRQFRKELGDRLSRRRKVLIDVRTALTDKRLEIYYQPKVSLFHGRVVGFEALLRLNGTEGRLATPSDFMPALEDLALSKEIGRFVVKAVLDQALEWQRLGVDYKSIAINLSASQFHEASFAQDFLNAIAARGLSASSFEVEVTEGVFLSTASNCVLTACEALREAGVRIAFDDFGTGFASLTHLRDFPVDVLKIDRSFIKELTAGGATTTIVNAMVSLANDLSMSVVAEGVETQDQERFLRAIGCHVAQGFYFSKPMASPTVATFLADWNQDSGDLFAELGATTRSWS
jgi:EAL domain-containing protein (putative c-di-GMP-specific phosphodiesterase class I)